MATLNMGYVAATGEILVASTTIPGTYEGNPVTALPQVTHAEDGDSLPGQEHDVSHTIYHHVREALYHRSHADPSEAAMFPENITDMQRIKIVRYEPEPEPEPDPDPDP